MSETVICRFGSGVQKAMEQQEGPEFCRDRCGKRESHYVIFHPDDARICSEFADAWHEYNDEEWRKNINRQ